MFSLALHTRMWSIRNLGYPRGSKLSLQRALCILIANLEARYESGPDGQTATC